MPTVASMTGPSATVYSYYYPEVAGLVRRFEQGQKERHMPRFATVPQVEYHLARNYDPGLDDLHEPLMDAYQQFARGEAVIGLETFSNRYFTNGSSEGIFHIMQSIPDSLPFYQLEGEYQGYEEFAKALGRNVKTFEKINDKYVDTDFDVAPGVFFLSNPSAVDGNILDREVLAAIGKRHQVVLDLAYMGATQKPLNIDLTHPNVRAVVASMSKPFGMYYYRVGFAWTRQPIPSLYGNKWFKNAHSILLAQYVLENIDISSVKDRYFELQGRAVQDLNNDSRYNLDNKLAGASARKARPSDVWMLAHAYEWSSNPQALEPFKRGKGYRFCLTPYFMEDEYAQEF